MKVVLATPPETYVPYAKTYHHSINIGYVASSLENHGHKVVIIDPNIENLDAKKAAKKIMSHSPDAIGVTATTHNRFQASELINHLKELTYAPIIVGGKHFTLTSVDALQKIEGIDIIVRHEGELTMPELLDAYSKDGDISKVKGIVYRDGKRIAETTPREYIKDLDSIPMPAWHLYDHKKYRPILEGDEDETLCVGVISTRGCPNNCSFCGSAAFWGRSLRRRSPQNFVDEIEFLHDKYGYRGFETWDDTLTIDRKHVAGICNELIERKLDIKWHARGRVNTVNREMLSLMRKSGCVGISYGIESGSQRILNKMKKNITIKQALDAIKTSSELGFNITAFFMHSLPGETLDDIESTTELMRKIYSICGQDWVPYRATFTRIYPGTEIEAIAKKEGLLPKDFSWNSYCTFSLPRLLGTDPTIPMYENPYLKIEQILTHLHKKNLSASDMAKMGMRSFYRIRSFEDLKIASKIVVGYLRGASDG